MTPEDVKRHFEETDALLTGHFKLSSGLHSDRYLQCAKVLQWPPRAQALGEALAEKLKEFGAQVVVSPAMGGLVIGQEVGRALSLRTIFAERVDGTFTFRRGFEVAPGERIVVVEDVITTGKSTGEVLDLLRDRAAKPVVCCSVVDRRGEERRRFGEEIAGLPVRSLLQLDVDTWDPSACPLCAAGVPLTAPGSRFLAKKD